MNRNTSRLNHTEQRGMSHYLLPAIAVLIVGLAGVYLMTASNAQTSQPDAPGVAQLQAAPRAWSQSVPPRKGADAELSWNNLPGEDGAGYTYRISRDNVLIGTTAQRNFTDQTAVYRKQHTYTVSRVDRQGAVSAPASVSLALPSNDDTEEPSAPTGLSSSVADREVSINWTPARDNDAILYYTVNRKMVKCGNSCDDTVSFIVTGSTRTAPKPTYTDTTVKPSSSYSYWVTATDPNGNVSTLSDLVPVEVR